MTENRPNALPFTVVVERERETRWMAVFKERVREDEQPRLGTIYVNKAAVGDAQRLTITVTEDA